MELTGDEGVAILVDPACDLGHEVVRPFHLFFRHLVLVEKLLVCLVWGLLLFKFSETSLLLQLGFFISVDTLSKLADDGLLLFLNLVLALNSSCSCRIEGCHRLDPCD